MDQETFWLLMQVMFGDHHQRQKANFKLRRKGVPGNIRLKAKHKGPGARLSLKRALRDTIHRYEFESGIPNIRPRLSVHVLHKIIIMILLRSRNPVGLLPVHRSSIRMHPCEGRERFRSMSLILLASLKNGLIRPHFR